MSVPNASQQILYFTFIFLGKKKKDFRNEWDGKFMLKCGI